VRVLGQEIVEEGCPTLRGPDDHEVRQGACFRRTLCSRLRSPQFVLQPEDLLLFAFHPLFVLSTLTADCHAIRDT
jgi:hypothetical protein